MTDRAQLAADMLRRIWSKAVPDSGAASVVASSDKVVLGTGKGGYTDLSGSLVVLDAKTGDIVRQNHDYWQVLSLALSIDGRWVATSEHPDFASGNASPGDADRIRILDVDTGAERCRHTGVLPPGTQALAFSPDGLSVAAIGDQHPLVFDAADGAERWRMRLDGAFTAIAWSPDSASVAVGHGNGVAVLDGRFGIQRVLAPCPAPVSAVGYTQDGGLIVAGCVDGTIRVFAAEDGVQSWSKQVSQIAVVSIAISGDQRWVAGVSRDKMLAVCDVRAGTPRYPPVPCELSSDATRVVWSPTLRHLLVMDYGSATSVIDARTGRVAHTCPGRCCLIPPEGAAIAAAGYFVVERYDLGVLIFERGLGARLAVIEMSPAGTPMVAVADTTAAVTVLDAVSGARLANKPMPGTIASVVFGDGGASVAVGGSSGVRLFSILGARSWTVDTVGAVSALAAAGPAGDWIATAAGKTLQLFSSATGAGRWPSPNTHPKPITRLAASSDGRWIATGCADRMTRIIDALTGAETMAVEGGDKIEAVLFQPNGSLVATVNNDGTIIVIDAATATKRDPATRPFPCGPGAFSFDGALLAVACRDDQNSVGVYDVTVGGAPQEIHRITCTAPVSDLAFNPTDDTLAICTSESLVVRDARTGIEMVRILRAVEQFIISADGALLATTGDDSVVRVFASGGSLGDQ